MLLWKFSQAWTTEILLFVLDKKHCFVSRFFGKESLKKSEKHAKGLLPLREIAVNAIENMGA